MRSYNNLNPKSKNASTRSLAFWSQLLIHTIIVLFYDPMTIMNCFIIYMASAFSTKNI